MYNDKKTPAYLRKLRIQKVFLIGLTGCIGYGIIAGYINFHNQVIRYTQSIVYRESQEATKEYTAKLINRNQQLLSRNQLDQFFDDEKKFDTDKKNSKNNH